MNRHETCANGQDKSRIQEQDAARRSQGRWQVAERGKLLWGFRFPLNACVCCMYVRVLRGHSQLGENNEPQVALED